MMKRRSNRDSSESCSPMFSMGVLYWSYCRGEHGENERGDNINHKKEQGGQISHGSENRRPDPRNTNQTSCEEVQHFKATRKRNSPPLSAALSSSTLCEQSPSLPAPVPLTGRVLGWSQSQPPPSQALLVLTPRQISSGRWVPLSTCDKDR